MITPSGPSSGGSPFKRVSGAVSLKDPTDSFDVPTGRTATVVVAASGALNNEAADYVCAAGNMDVARTVIEDAPYYTKIVLIGDFTKDDVSAIQISSRVDIEIVGRISFADDVGDGAIIFANSNTGWGADGINIHGGVLDGNRANQTSPAKQTAIQFTNVGYCYVDTAMQNFSGYNVEEITPRSGNTIVNRNFPNIARIEPTQGKFVGHPLVKRLSNFEVDWTADHGTTSYDSDIKFSGSRSMKLETDVADYANAHYTLPTPADLAKSGFGIMIYMEDPTAVERLLCTFASTPWSSYVQSQTYGWHVLDSMPANEWIYLSFPIGDLTSSGTPDISNIEAVQIRIVAEAGKAAVVRFNEFTYAKTKLIPKGAVSLTFDDGYLGVYTLAKPALDAHKHVGVVPIIGPAPAADEWDISCPHLKEMRDAGWDIISHDNVASYVVDGYTIVDSPALCEETILGQQDWMNQNGFKRGARFNVYPGGTHSKIKNEIVRNHFLLGRSTWCPSIGKGLTFLPMLDSVELDVYGYSSSTSLDDCLGYIKNARDRGAWMNLSFHNVVASGASGNETNIADIETILDYIDEIGIPVTTYSKLYDDILFAPVQETTQTDILMDVLAVSATHVRSNEDLSAAIPITFTLDAQPDIPRTLSWAFDTHTNISAYDMEVIGTDGRGETVTETWDETDGWAGETNNAFATITSIKMTSRTDPGTGDTMDIGITDVIGIPNAIWSKADVFKIKKNNANAAVAAAQVDVTYGTYDMSVIGLGAADDFTIWYKTVSLLR